VVRVSASADAAAPLLLHPLSWPGQQYMNDVQSFSLIKNSRNPDEPDVHRDGNGIKELLAPEETKLKPPPLYRVVLLNDDYTPMEFVVDVLRQFFGMNTETATRVMLKVHTEGKGICGVYPREIAETKAVQVNEHARAAEHPLMCDIEVDD
jgi:ATP-dependent Clp protease adaptor protein ClpS